MKRKAVYLTDTTTWKTIHPPMYVIKCRANDKGVVMNHCPFCGESINERWTKAAPSRDGLAKTTERSGS